MNIELKTKTYYRLVSRHTMVCVRYYPWLTNKSPSEVENSGQLSHAFVKETLELVTLAYFGLSIGSPVFNVTAHGACWEILVDTRECEDWEPALDSVLAALETAGFRPGKP